MIRKGFKSQSVITMTTNNNSNVTVNSLYGKHGNMRSCNGFDCSLHEKYSKEEAASVLSGDIHLEEIVVIRPRTELGFRIWKAEETILAWLGDHGKFVVADASYSKDQLKSHLNGGWYFSGHRGGNGPQSSLMMEEALNTFCPGWYSKVENFAGPSSWRIDVSVKDDGTIIASNMGNDIVLGKL